MLSKLKSLVKKLRKKSNYLFRSGRRMGGVIEVASMSGQSWTQLNGVAGGYFTADSNEPTEGDSTNWVTTSSSTIGGTNVNVYKTTKPKDERIEKKPVEIWNEIISEVPKIDLVDIDKKIKVVKRRHEFLTEEMGYGANDEKIALGFLEARRKFPKYGPLFTWAATNMGQIDKLCRKYKVQYVDFYGYYKNVPNEALDELERFLDAWKKVRKDEPTIKLITDQGGPEHKKDPILLASSPFGKWFYILGAWDREVEFVDELVYGNG
jgi:hypothetical protein